MWLDIYSSSADFFQVTKKRRFGNKEANCYGNYENMSLCEFPKLRHIDIIMDNVMNDLSAEFFLNISTKQEGRTDETENNNTGGDNLAIEPPSGFNKFMYAALVVALIVSILTFVWQARKRTSRSRLPQAAW